MSKNRQTVANSLSQCSEKLENCCYSLIQWKNNIKEKKKNRGISFSDQRHWKGKANIIIARVQKKKK